jgi:hypothetical protein
MTATPNTIVFIHGLWMTPRSWEDWICSSRSAFPSTGSGSNGSDRPDVGRSGAGAGRLRAAVEGQR